MTDSPSYQVIETDRGYEVLSPGGYTVIVCNTQQNAAHYRQLLAEAYNLGSKAGFRAAKAADRK